MATVWNAAYIWRQGKGFTLDNSRYSYMRYYPGDEYADWWGLSLFLPEVFDSAVTGKFLANAAAHKKPVMIAETTPLRIGTTDGQRDWDAWFAPYFSFINNHPVIKALCYINWDWAAKSAEYNLPWGDWGDCRLEVNKLVTGLYQGRMAEPHYFHGRGEKEFRKALGVRDDTPPGSVSALNALFKTCNVLISWSPANDDTGIARYEVYRGSTFLGSTVQNSFTDSNIRAGSVSTYAVKSVDMGGNAGQEVFTGKVRLPLSIDKVEGGDFESAGREWIVRTWSGGEMTFSRETGAPLSGKASAELHVKKGTGTNWHVQFSHYVKSFKGMKYTLSFTIKADAPADIDVFLQQAHDPYESVISRTITAERTAKTCVLENDLPARDDSLFLTFMCGRADKRTIWLDDIRVVETKIK